MLAVVVAMGSASHNKFMNMVHRDYVTGLRHQEFWETLLYAVFFLAYISAMKINGGSRLLHFGTGRFRFTTVHFTIFHINDCFKILPQILVHTWKNFSNFGTYLIKLHYILVSFYDFPFYDPVLLEPNPVVKRVPFWSRFTTFHFTTLFCWNLTLSLNGSHFGLVLRLFILRPCFTGT
jgi:hypothetical protein